MPHYGEKKAGGMSYWTLEGDQTTALKPYLEGLDKQSQSVIFKRNQEYYIASAEKTIARLELAKTRVKCTGISDKKYLMLMDKISTGLNWLNALKNEINDATNDQELQTVISYKKWHAVKLLPSAAEGYAIAYTMDLKINYQPKIKLIHKTELANAKHHKNHAQKIFKDLLNLKENSDFQKAEISRLDAFEGLEAAQIIINSMFDR